MRSATQKNNVFLESIASSHLVRNASYGKKLIKQIRFFFSFFGITSAKAKFSVSCQGRNESAAGMCNGHERGVRRLLFST